MSINLRRQVFPAYCRLVIIIHYCWYLALGSKAAIVLLISEYEQQNFQNTILVGPSNNNWKLLIDIREEVGGWTSNVWAVGH